MQCILCPTKDFKNKKSFSNHYRWHEGKMKVESYAGINKAEKNGRWKGDSVGYIALHDFMKRQIEKPAECANCGKLNASLDLANISQKYIRDVLDWKWLCRSCHMKEDGRILNLKQYKKETV